METENRSSGVVEAEDVRGRRDSGEQFGVDDRQYISLPGLRNNNSGG